MPLAFSGTANLTKRHFLWAVSTSRRRILRTSTSESTEISAKSPSSQLSSSGRGVSLSSQGSVAIASETKLGAPSEPKILAPASSIANSWSTATQTAGRGKILWARVAWHEVDAYKKRPYDLWESRVSRPFFNVAGTMYSARRGPYHQPQQILWLWQPRGRDQEMSSPEPWQPDFINESANLGTKITKPHCLLLHMRSSWHLNQQ